MTLFSLVNQTTGNWKAANTFCSNFNTSPLNGWAVTSSRMPSESDVKNISLQTHGIAKILCVNDFWTSSIGSYGNHSYVYNWPNATVNESIGDNQIVGVNPLITLEKS